MKIIYSITCHESPECILDQVRNYLFFERDSKIVIHVNASSNEVFNKINARGFFADKEDRVFVNPIRYDTSKNSYSLHKAHVANLKFLNERAIDFDYLVLESSNSLMVKHGIGDHISNFDVGLGFGKVDQYWARNIKSHKALQDYLRGYMPRFDAGSYSLKGCHEGAFFRASLVNSVFSIVEAIDSYCAKCNSPPSYPTEEIWFQCAYAILKSGYTNVRLGGTTTYLPWDKNLYWSEKDVVDILNSDSLPKGKFSIKRVERNPSDRVRRLISEKYRNYS